MTWVRDVLDESWAHDGVVLCGRCVVADDCSWAVPSRSPTLYTAREVFLVMRNSIKFVDDVHAQRRAFAADVEGCMCNMGTAACMTCTADTRHHTLQFSLCKALAGTAAKEMRLFLPYQLCVAATSRDNAHHEEDEDDDNAKGGVAEAHDESALRPCPCSAHCVDSRTSPDSPLTALPQYDYVGIAQRFTDVCLPSLMSWTADEHARNFAVMLNRVRQAKVLSLTCALKSNFLTDLVAALRRWWSTSPHGRAQYVRECAAAGTAEAHAVPEELPLAWMTCLVAVDVMFENASLPVYVLSAKVRLVVRGGMQGPDLSDLPLIWEGNTKAHASACAREETGAHVPSTTDVHTSSISPSSSSSSSLSPPALPEGSGAVADEQHSEAREHGDDDDTSHDCCSSYQTTGAEFLRLFRDAHNWNCYVQLLHDRQTSTGAHVVPCGQPCSSDDTTIGGPVRARDSSSDRVSTSKPYCVIATDSSDLTSSTDVMAKRSLPLEFVQPELLYANPDAQVFLQRLREAMQIERDAPSHA